MATSSSNVLCLPARTSSTPCPASSLAWNVAAPWEGATRIPTRLTPKKTQPRAAARAVRSSNAERTGKPSSAPPSGKPQQEQKSSVNSSRREILLHSSSVALLASVFNFSGTQPSYLGVQRSPPSLALCPSTPNCISTSEEINDPGHYVPPWTYNPQDGRGRKNPATQEQAMEELVSVVTSTKPDGFEPTITKRTKDYLYVEYKSGFFGFVDDVEFWFPPGNSSLVEYRSASRLGEGDFNINRKRIRVLRKELEKYGWESVGF